jgi:signal transduction histidine kinase
MTPVALRRRDSLRWRLPLMISVVVLIVLSTFLWTMTRALEQTLLRGAGDRAQAAAEEIATAMNQSMVKGVADLRRATSNDAVVQYFDAPSKESADRVKALLQPAAAPGQPPIELWDAQRGSVMQITPAHAEGDDPAVPPPPGPAPGAPGLSPFHLEDGRIRFELVADVTAPAAAGAPGRRIGVLVLRRSLMPAQTEMVNRLVGNGGLVEVGNRNGTLWTDFAKPLPGPLVDVSHDRISEYRTAEGERKIGASHMIAATPWVTWIEFPRDVVLAPARTLFRRMLAVGVFFVLIAAGLVAMVTSRITTPLHELTRASEAIAAGDVSERVRADRGDEIGRLGRAFNAMAERIGEAQRLLELRVEERTAGLRDAMEELESFSYSVSHDLRAPLRHVVGFASLLEQSSSAALGDEGRRHLHLIIDAASRMGRLIDDLLAFSRVSRTPITKRRVDLNQLVADAREEVVGGDSKPGPEWRVHPLPTVEGDHALLRLVLVNLLSNAVKYSSRVAHPAIEVGTIPGNPGEAVVFVRDNGEGFDMQYAHKLFGVFQRLHAHDEFEGTGIGLANVRRIVQRLGGRTWAEGVVMGGATFYFSLPA